MPRSKTPTASFRPSRTAAPAPDLIAVLDAPTAIPVTLGAGTPWVGIRAASYRGTVTALGDISLDGQFVGGSDSSFQIVAAAGGSPVNVNLIGTLGASLANYSGVAKFLVTSAHSTLSVDTALGGGSDTLSVPVDVSSTGNLTVTSSAAINATALFHTGSTLTIQTAGLNGSGALSRDAAPLTVVLANALALSGPQTAGFIQPGDTIGLAADNIPNLASFDPSFNFTLPFPASARGTVSEAGTIHLNGSSLTGNGILQPSPRSDLLLDIGSSGATFGSSIIVSARIQAAGDLNIVGVATLNNTLNQFQGVDRQPRKSVLSRSPARPLITLNQPPTWALTSSHSIRWATQAPLNTTTP